jgi:signal transduction histidine kinase
MEREAPATRVNFRDDPIPGVAELAEPATESRYPRQNDGVVKRASFLGFEAPLLFGFLALCALTALRMTIARTITKSDGDAPWVWLFISSFGRSFVRYTGAFVLVVVVLKRVRSTAWQVPMIIAAVIVGVVIGWLLSAWLEFRVDPVSAIAGVLPGNWENWGLPGDNRNQIAADAPGILTSFCMLSGLLAAIYVFYVRAIKTEDESRRQELRRIDLERQMSEARLKVLEAQIEPHFIFNALANVQRLFETDPAAGNAMLRQLSRYLSAALPRMREAESTLGREVELATAYLSVQQIRMGRRLVFDIDVPDGLTSATIPPMMLTTLAENAVRHGLGPLPEGGYLRISARAQGDLLRLQVADTGRGFEAHAGAGVGLANIRARLAAQYGAHARLAITRNSPRGVTATIVLPRAVATTRFDTIPAAA